MLHRAMTTNAITGSEMKTMPVVMSTFGVFLPAYSARYLFKKPRMSRIIPKINKIAITAMANRM